MVTEDRMAIATFAAEMAAAFAKLASALGEPSAIAPTRQSGSEYSPASAAMPWNERVLRQSLILHEIKERGGNVPQTTWYEIAARYGYAGRGLAGFFRSNGQGLLDLRNNKVYITKRGRERLAQNQDRVSNILVAERVAAQAVAARTATHSMTEAEVDAHAQNESALPTP